MIDRAPTVSICIPTYKGEAHLPGAIRSVLEQTYADFELLIVNDNSPGNTDEIVHSFEDNRIRYLRNERNLGPQGNWNRCREIARGKYFKLLPHDDVLHPRCLERQVSVLDSDVEERFALVFCAREVIGPDERIIARRGFPGAKEGRISGADTMRACVRRGTNLLGEPGAVLFRRTLADRIGPFDASNPYVIDLDYWFRLLAHGDAYYCEDTLASFRVSGGSWSVAIGRAQDRDFIGLVSRMAGNILPSLTATDLLSARVSAKLNMWLRMAFYAVYLR